MYNRILAPLDGSKLSECSLDHIKSIATGCHVSEVILLAVVEVHSPIRAEYSNLSQIEEDVREREKAQKLAQEAAEQYLDTARNIVKKQEVTVKNVVIQSEQDQSVADIILDYADNNNIDLIVISTHGRSGITRWAFGSVADRVVRHSKTPVLLVAPPGCRV